MFFLKEDRVAISKALFKEGVLYAPKDFNLPKHPEVDVPNLQVIKLMQSFKSKEYVKETFSWSHYYWYLTNEGIEYLRMYLNLPSETVPATLKKSTKRTLPRTLPPGGGGNARGHGDRPHYDGDREYRAAGSGGPGAGFGDKFQPSFRRRGGGGSYGSGDKGGAPAEFQPSFRQGFGRGGGSGYGGAPGAFS